MHKEIKLRKKIWKSVMFKQTECKFCENIGIGLPDWDFLDETKQEFSGMAICIRKIINDYALVFTNSANEYGAGAISIKYCPMCGRKLKNE